MYYIGVDHHKNYSFMAVMDELGSVVDQRKVNNSQESINAFLEPYKNQSRAVLEAGRNWTLMYDWLENIVGEISLAHPLKVKAIAEARIKTDKIDANILAHLLRTDLLPSAYVPTMQARIARQTLRHRMFLVRIQTMIKNRIRLIVDKHPDVDIPNGLFSKKGLVFLKENKENFAPDSDVLAQEIILLESIQKRIKASNELIARIANERDDVKHLKTIPGIGDFFAALIAYEIDNINRFPNPKKLAAYTGLVPSTYASGNRVFHGRITKQGNKSLRWAFVEAVWPAIKKDGQLRQYYQRIKERKGANPAKVATARRLLTIAYHVLKDKRDYQVRELP